MKSKLALEKSPDMDDVIGDNFHPEKYTIVDVRNWGEINAGKIFSHAIAIPLPELREWVNEIPVHKAHHLFTLRCWLSLSCRNQYYCRQNNFKSPVYDLGEAELQRSEPSMADRD